MMCHFIVLSDGEVIYESSEPLDCETIANVISFQFGESVSFLITPIVEPSSDFADDSLCLK